MDLMQFNRQFSPFLFGKHECLYQISLQYIQQLLRFQAWTKVAPFLAMPLAIMFEEHIVSPTQILIMGKMLNGKMSSNSN